MESRIQRMMPEFGPDEKRVRKVIEEKDKAKADLVKTFFHKDIHDPLLYDVQWNTSRVPIDEIADILIQMIRRKASESC